ncbi:MAG: cytochrome c biogenesis protein ResB [Mariprofundaceae bacterium]
MRSLSEPFKRAWVRLGSMSLAIILLVVLSIASVIGTVLLQNQDQADYLQQFGPLWYWVFRSLGLFDMYHTWWFLTLLGFLMLSLTACLWRNIPKMFKEMHNRKVWIADKTLHRLPFFRRWEGLKVAPEAVLAAFRKALPGWEFREESFEGTRIVRADKGRWNKWGYILTHAGILVILIGGWVSVQFGFRGNMAVPEGQTERTISFLKGTETETMEMPFRIRCNDFHIEFFPTGQPKEFRSNLTIIDQGQEVLTKDIIVNEPLYYKGVRIYQASFGDGGSTVRLKLFPLGRDGEVREIETRVYETWKDPETGISLEITDFRPYNIENIADPGAPKEFHDLGPSVEYVLRGPGLRPVKVKAFMNPFERGEDNRGSFLMVSLSGDQNDFQPVMLGVDLTDAREWRLFRAFMRHLVEAGTQSREANLQAFRAAMREVFGDERPDNFQQMAMRVLQSAQMLPQLPWPVLPMLVDYDQVYYTGLQLAKDPGMNIVWIGSAILVIGLCIMFYLPHRKLWLVIRAGEGGREIELGGMTNRNEMAFRNFVHELFIRLDDDWRKPSPASGGTP